MWGQVHIFRGTIMLRALCCLFGLIGVLQNPSAMAQSSHELRTVLSRLAGSWEGEVSIQSLDGREIGRFRAKRVYVWSGDVMEVESTLVMGEGEHTTRGRYFVRLGRLYATVSRPGQPAQDYTGESAQGRVFWESALRDNRDLIESVLTEAESQRLEIDSFEVLGLEEIPGVVRIQGRLAEVRDPDEVDVVAHEVGTGTEWLGPSDPLDLFQTYAPKK
ncbi:MAG: hypothetical protein DRP71_10635 [Verrucomicrobia bacterium]|nr:MAG: hypothetical protein DRP71_10635 [Verrucomicrobiota bacterium]